MRQISWPVVLAAVLGVVISLVLEDCIGVRAESDCATFGAPRHQFEITTNSGTDQIGRGNIGYMHRNRERSGEISDFSAKDYRTPNARLTQISRISVIANRSHANHDDLGVELLDRGILPRSRPGIDQFPAWIVSRLGDETVVWQRPSALTRAEWGVSSEAMYTLSCGTISDVWKPNTRIAIELHDVQQRVARAS